MKIDRPRVRKGMPSPRLGQDEYLRRFKAQFRDPAFHSVATEVERVARVAWEAYADSRKSPLTRRAGAEFADPQYELSLEWIAARDAMRAAQRAHDDPSGPMRFLLINAAARSEHTCPGEMSKSWRLVSLAQAVLESATNRAIDVLDLSRVASEYGRQIHPCKTCFSTAAPLCHWPCSCYPNYALGQTHDWMNEIYPLWVAAHGILIISPVNWFQVSSPLKLMMDRLVCADGGNADPTRTHGKDAQRAKEIELSGWDYPQHLKGRLFACVVHGDAEGVESVRRSIADWLVSMGLISAATLDRYIGYWEPYATSHQALDRDQALQEEVRNTTRTLLEGVAAARSGKLVAPDAGLRAPRQK